MGRKITQYASRRITRKLTRAVPFVGGLIALATLGRAIRRKGWLGGTVDTALDFAPGVSTIKNVAEVARGRDFISDQPHYAAAAARRRR